MRAACGKCKIAQVTEKTAQVTNKLNKTMIHKGKLAAQAKVTFYIKLTYLAK